MTDKILTKRQGGVSWLIFNQPEKRNAMSLDMTVKALEVVQEFARDETARVLIVTGAGDKAFVSGADISEFEEKRSNAAAAAEYAAVSQRMFHAIHDVEKPTIAMIHGYCFGGGVALAAACDIRVCSEDALFSIPAAKLGIGYRVDFTRWIIDLVGPAYAKEILYTARRFTAAEAHHMGLVNRVLPKAELETYVLSDAHMMAENAPLSLKVSKVVVNECLKDPAERDTAKCERLIAACMESEDYKNARRAFMEKRKPAFTGR
jgi:enoyl-CoA hydratase/carnithine racemase